MPHLVPSEVMAIRMISPCWSNSWYYRSLFVVVLSVCVCVGGGGGHKGGPGSVVIHGAFVCCLFKRSMVYAFTNARYSRCGNETGKDLYFQM